MNAESRLRNLVLALPHPPFSEEKRAEIFGAVKAFNAAGTGRDWLIDVVLPHYLVRETVVGETGGCQERLMAFAAIAAMVEKGEWWLYRCSECVLDHRLSVLRRYGPTARSTTGQATERVGFSARPYGGPSL